MPAMLGRGVWAERNAGAVPNGLKLAWPAMFFPSSVDILG